MAAQVARYVRSDTEPVMLNVATAKAIPFGSLVAVESDGSMTLPADQAWNTSEAQTRTDWVAKFAGVAMQEKAANVARIPGNSEDNRIRVATAGIYEFNFASAVSPIAGYTMFGPSKDTGNALENLTVKVVTAITEAVAIAFQTKTSATKCWGKLISTRFRYSQP